ncbi:MAG: histidinol-phosphatase [candidate division WOR-3 bacterium]|nr:MAG: histidinol-phosphatase [candidate division WOR-3 bacterium]
MIDYHIHTDHSTDASGTIAEYCQRALQIGLKEICFTNHCELDPQRNDSFIRFNGEPETLSNRGLTKLQEEVFQARERFSTNGLSVKFGIEVGYYPGMEKELNRVMDGLSLDFVIGAIHCLDHICIDSSRECDRYYDDHDVTQYVTEYMDAVSSLIRSRLFDSLAHVDVHKKYGRNRYGQNIDNVPRDLIAGVFGLMKEHGIAMEINTAGMRFMNEFYPAPALMEIAREHHLEYITIGSDSHQPADLGKDLDLAIDYLKSFDFHTIYRFDNRQPSGISI